MGIFNKGNKDDTKDSNHAKLEQYDDEEIIEEEDDFEEEFSEEDDQEEESLDEEELSSELQEEILEDINYSNEDNINAVNTSEQLIDEIYKYSEQFGIDDTIMLLSYAQKELTKKDIINQLMQGEEEDDVPKQQQSKK